MYPEAAPRSHWLGDAAERAAGALLLAASSPLLLGSAAAVAILSRRTPFVAHLRVGQGDQPFWMLKLRTMWTTTEALQRSRGWIEYIAAEPGDDGKTPRDPRINSRFAAFLRRHSIDEFPQFWHVLRGEMALIGPRPLTRGEVTRHYGAHAAELLSVKPGITGLWQVYGRSRIRFPQRSAMDLELVRSLTARMYFAILWRTLVAFLSGDGAW